MGNKLLIPIIAVVVVIVLGGAGFFLYKKNMIPWIGKKAPIQVAAKPAQQEAPKIPPAADSQKAELPVVPAPAPAAPAPVETKPVTPPATPPAQAAKPTPPIPAPIPELKQPVTKTAPTPAPAPKPTPVPTPAPVPAKAAEKPSVKPSGKIIYSVQIGAFKSEANASALTKQYKDKGYDAFTQKAQKDKETIYRALVGKLDNAKEAAKLSETIRTKENTKGIIVKE